MNTKTELKRGQPCFARIEKRWHAATFVSTYYDPPSVKVLLGGEEWTIFRAELFTVQEKQAVELQEFCDANKLLFNAIKSTPPDKLNKAQICRDLEITYGHALYVLKKARELEINLTYAAPMVTT